MLVPKVTPSHNAPRKRRTALSLDRVVDTAFAIVDAEGMDALSARRLARELGCEAMSLYHHVPSMDALIDHVIGRLLAQCPLPSPSQAKGQDPLRRACMDYLALAQRHPRVFALATGRRWTHPAAYALAGALVNLIIRKGQTERRATRTARTLAAYLNGAGMALSGLELSRSVAATPAPPPASAEMARLQKRFSPDTVRADLMHGLDLLLAALVPPADASGPPGPESSSRS